MDSMVFGIYFQCAYAILLTMQKFNRKAQYQRNLSWDLGYLRSMGSIVDMGYDLAEWVV